ncbi:MAG: signal recognition particle protein Srp19 [Methanosarcinales archaeon]|nr:signal recognition particle protein Srp19 [Methanosarcinales archaeon]
MPQRDKIVIWPPYLDSTESRSSGRRVARRNAVKSPTTDEIVAAVRSLNPDLDPIVEEAKAYPASWWKTSGRVLVAKTQTPKSSILREVASEIKKMRSAN